MSRPRAPFAAALLFVAACLATAGCKESGLDHYSKGLSLLGEAERGDCKLGYDENTGQQIINASRITTCLEKTRAGLEELYKARELGVDNRESRELIEKTEQEIEHMEEMLRTVSRMEHERILD